MVKFIENIKNKEVLIFQVTSSKVHKYIYLFIYAQISPYSICASPIGRAIRGWIKCYQIVSRLVTKTSVFWHLASNCNVKIKVIHFESLW